MIKFSARCLRLRPRLIHANEFQRTKQKLNEILIKHTGHSYEKIEQDTDRDNFMSSEEAVQYNLIDRVIAHIGDDK